MGMGMGLGSGLGATSAGPPWVSPAASPRVHASVRQDSSRLQGCCAGRTQGGAGHVPAGVHPATRLSQAVSPCPGAEWVQ